MCSAHFNDDDYSTPRYVKRPLLIDTAVPSLFNWTVEKKVRKPPKKRFADNSSELRPKKQHHLNEVVTSTSKATVTADVCEIMLNSAKYSNEDIDERECTLQSYLVKRVADHDNNTAPQTIEEQLYAARKRIAELEAQASLLQVSKFGIERFSRSPKLIKFYTELQIINV